MEKRLCQNCKAEFTIAPEDFDFYEKLKVPAPTFCPECRMKRRMIWRNERVLYRSKCGLCEKPTLSTFSEDAGIIGYCPDCWWSDKWDAMAYGKEYDFSKPFFDQFRELMGKVPYMAVQTRNSPGTTYANFTADAKNVYMGFCVVDGAEDVMYSKNIDKSRKIVDSLDVMNSENCYEVNKGDKNYNSKYLFDCRNCIDSLFLVDCSNCQNCFMSSGLRNKNYYYRNQQVSKDEYEAKIKTANVGSYSSILSLKQEFENMKLQTIRRYASILNCVDCSGNDLRDSKNAHNCFNGYQFENVKYIARSIEVKDSMDVINGAHTELLYEFMAGGGINGRMLRFSYSGMPGLMEVDYTHYCGSSSYLFGCIGLRNKQYCIFNRQYTKEEYETLREKIIAHMNEMPYRDALGMEYRYGEFFPMELCPFAYNETVAQEHFPLPSLEVEKQGYRWKEVDKKEYSITKYPNELSDLIGDSTDSLTGEVIGCAHAGTCGSHQCTTAFKIIPEELSFYRNMNIPLPRLCPNCRHYGRLTERNPLKLWHRSCMCDGSTSSPQASKHGHEGKCKNEFETSYAPERPEIVYCESCYQKEVI